MEKYVIDGKELDKNQIDVVLDDSKSLLVVAGAGSGKTLTIIGKVNYLIQNKICLSDEILCISFTNDATNSLKEKLHHYDLDIMTFHKLSINILKKNNISYELCKSDYLDYIVHEFFYGIIFENKFLMKSVLKLFKKNSFYNIEKKYKTFIYSNKKNILSFEKLIVKFIRLFKTNGFDYKYFFKIIKKTFSAKEKLFLIICFNIYLIYGNELNSSAKYDFDDLIIKASDVVYKYGFIKKYKYIIIDEFQDTSYIRYNLIKSILLKTNSKLIAVGDDYQSIFRFTGCDLKIFVEFKKYFTDSKILKLENTYRNSQELINVCSKFITKNKSQIKKNLKSSKRLYKPIKIYYGKTINSILDSLEGSIMILGRNNNDINKYLNEDLKFDNNNLIYSKKEYLKINYYTVHSSKGLEADNVIVVNVTNDLLGFPNKIEDDRVLRFVSKINGQYDEERRLFYVALTRTKNNVYLVTNRFKESSFIKEILRYGYKNIEIIKKE